VRSTVGSSQRVAASAGRWAWLARCLGACALALLAVCGSLAWVTTARASRTSSEGVIIMTPDTAAAGTQVNAEVHIFVPPVQDFVLKATTTAPVPGAVQGACASAIPIPGAPTFTAGGPPGGQVTFTWPASLGTDMYWLCAFPTAGGPDQAHTSAPFIITKDAAPALKVTPDFALPGSTLTVAISDWLAPDHLAPAHLWIPSPDGNTRSEVSFQVLSPPDGTGACTLSFVLPLNFNRGSWYLIAGSTAYYQRSDTFTVEDPAIATDVAIMHASPTPSPAATRAPGNATSVSPLSDNTSLVLALGAGGVLLLVAGGIALRVMRRR
jgi:hypothetical protein